jgi:manganese-dependent inorganic pyrophosphatase
MSEKIYVIGHKSPDLDSVAAAISYANYQNLTDNARTYIPAVAGELNQLTQYVLEKFGIDRPEILADATDKKIFLVDHNEEAQKVAGGEVVGILDHHKMNFSNSNPIRINVWPLGSSNSIIYKLYQWKNLEINKELAGLMLSAVLDDTVITKSPTCTAEDKTIIDELSKLAGIENWQEYGIEMFKVKASVSQMSDEEIIKMDYKDFEMKAGKFGIGQVETVDLSDFKSREETLLTGIEKIREAGNYHSVILFVTDIMKGGSQFLVSSSDENALAEAFNTKFENHRAYVDGIMSRKKQVVPAVTEKFDK